MFELHRLPGKANHNWDEQHALRLIYFNETINPINSNPQILRIPICLEDELCQRKKFFAFIADYTLTGAQWSEMCYLVSSSNWDSLILLISWVFLVILVLTLLLVLYQKRFANFLNFRIFYF